jgi:DNA-binding SARP family transcriptional activator
MLVLRLFGAGSCRFEGQPLSGFPNQQSSQLLCYLLLNRGNPHRREAIAAVFWGDQPGCQARKALRNSLWRLRQSFQSAGASLEDYLSVTENQVSFLFTGNYWLDVEEFERMMALLEHVHGLDMSREQCLQLEKTVNLYQGDLLENNYEDWVLYERERHSLAYENMLFKLMVYHGSHERPEQGITWGERILLRNNTLENVHRCMMWLYCLSGNRSAALAQYKRCRQILRDEMGIEPMDKTRELSERIASDRFDPRTWRHGALDPSVIPDNARHFSDKKTVLTMQNLKQLKNKLDETRAELRMLDRLISEAMGQQP